MIVAGTHTHACSDCGRPAEVATPELRCASCALAAGDAITRTLVRVFASAGLSAQAAGDTAHAAMFEQLVRQELSRRPATDLRSEGAVPPSVSSGRIHHHDQEG